MFLRITRYVLLIHRHHLRCMQPENRLERARAVASCAKSAAPGFCGCCCCSSPLSPVCGDQGPNPKRLDAGACTCRGNTFHSAPAAARDSAMCSHTALSRACCSFTHLRLAPSPWLPFCVVPSHASAVCLASAFAGSGRRCPWACAWRGRNGSQVRLPGTALWYGSQGVYCVRCRAPRTSAPVSSPIQARIHSPQPRTPSTHPPSSHPRTLQAPAKPTPSKFLSPQTFRNPRNF